MTTTTGAPKKLYVWLTHDVDSFKGGTIDLRWSPAGNPDVSCYTHGTMTFPTSSGSTCTYLNRGTATPRFFLNSDVTGDLNMEFWPADSTGFAQVNVMWAGANPAGRRDTVAVSMLDGTGPDTLYVTPAPISDSTPPSTRTIIGANPVLLYFGSSPILVACRRHFTAYQSRWGVTGIADAGPGRRRVSGLRVRGAGTTSPRAIAWSLDRPRTNASLRIYDVTGRLVRSFALDGMHATEGVLPWSTDLSHTRAAASGVYLAVLEGDGRSLARARFLVVKP